MPCLDNLATPLGNPKLTVAFRFLLCGVEKAREGSLEDARRAAKDRVLRDFELLGVSKFAMRVRTL